MAHAATDERPAAEGAHGAVDDHGHAPADPNAAPMHHDLKLDFTMAHAVIAATLGTVAIAAGIIFGIVLAND